jgi:hypothetical protein
MSRPAVARPRTLEERLARLDLEQPCVVEVDVVEVDVTRPKRRDSASVKAAEYARIAERNKQYLAKKTMRNTRSAAEFQAYQESGATRARQEERAHRAREEEKADERRRADEQRRADEESRYRADAEPDDEAWYPPDTQADVDNAKAVLAMHKITDKKARDKFYRRNHPDKNLNDAAAEERFKAVNNAWTTVEDDRRKNFFNA